MKDKLLSLWSHVKQALKSKVLWFNATIATLIPLMPDIIQQAVDSIPELQPYVPTDTYKTLTIIGVIGNAYLRYHTKMAVKDK